MKIALASDLHLEFGGIIFDNTENADVLILSGDIMVASHFWVVNDPQCPQWVKQNVNTYRGFMEMCVREFKHVVYVMGNHEHYDGDFKYTLQILRNQFEYLDNVHILEKSTFELNDIVFVGSTLWTDFNRNDPLTKWNISKRMNDFQSVCNTTNAEMGRIRPLFTPSDAYEEHIKTLEYIDYVCRNNDSVDKKIVVVGHHTPSEKSIHPKYEHDTEMNFGYFSELSEFILDHPKIVAWTHGHTHEPFDYKIGDTRVICNPRGYHGYEEMAKFFKLKYFEV